MDPQKRRSIRAQQAKLREAFMDLANVFVSMRMTFLRRMGAQPPEEKKPHR